MTASPGLIDSHCHLDYLQRDGVLDDALAAARDGGLGGMLTIGTLLDDAAVAQGAAIAAAHPDVWRTVGLHPHNAGAAPDDLRGRLRALADQPDVVGLGEAGLDYHYDKAPRDRQAEAFEAHLDVAAETGLPLVVHTREAEDDTLAILRRHHGRVGGVLHSFPRSQAMADAAVAMGSHIRLTGLLTLHRPDATRATPAALPRAPLPVRPAPPPPAPAPYPGNPCQPAYVAQTAAALAEARGVSAAEIAAQTTANFHALFPRTAAA